MAGVLVVLQFGTLDVKLTILPFGTLVVLDNNDMFQFGTLVAPLSIS
jgi:hypothetical protein